MSVPIRTCVGCRQRRPQAELLRYRRRSDGHVTLSDRRGHGRSAYVCTRRACIDRAMAKRGFSRSLGRGRTVICDVAAVSGPVIDRLVGGEVA